MTNTTHKTGARVRITTAEGSSGWGSNLILDNATERMKTGYPSSPTPILGQSIIAVDASQTGVQAPLPKMTMSSKVDGAPEYVRVNGQTCKVVTVTKYYFRNTDTVTANVSEIGYTGLNRALFVDEGGLAKAWPVADQEEVIIEVEFTMVVSSAAAPIAINVVDQDDVTVDTITVAMTTMFSETDGPGNWWDLLKPAAGNTGIYLVTDQNWDGTGPASSGFYASKAAVLTYANRNIHVAVEHVGAVGGQTIKGYYLELAGKPPYVCAVFDKALTIGGNYTFKSELSIDW